MEKEQGNWYGHRDCIVVQKDQSCQNLRPSLYGLQCVWGGGVFNGVPVRGRYSSTVMNFVADTHM